MKLNNCKLCQNLLLSGGTTTVKQGSLCDFCFKSVLTHHATYGAHDLTIVEFPRNGAHDTLDAKLNDINNALKASNNLLYCHELGDLYIKMVDRFFHNSSDDVEVLTYVMKLTTRVMKYPSIQTMVTSLMHTFEILNEIYRVYAKRNNSQMYRDARLKVYDELLFIIRDLSVFYLLYHHHTDYKFYYDVITHNNRLCQYIGVVDSTLHKVDNDRGDIHHRIKGMTRSLYAFCALQLLYGKGESSTFQIHFMVSEINNKLSHDILVVFSALQADEVKKLIEQYYVKGE